MLDNDAADTTRVFAVHPHWESFLRLDPENARLVHERNKSEASFKRDGALVTVAWDAFPAETFRAFGTRWVSNKLSDIGGAPERRMTMVQGTAEFPVTRFSVAVPDVGCEVELRVGTSDIPTFRQIFSHREYDSADLPPEPRTILDLGANVGLSSTLFAARYPTARIFALEPDADNFVQLQRNTSSFRGRIECCQGAAWKEDTRLSLTGTNERGHPLGAWGFRVSDAVEAAADRTVPAWRLSSIIAKAGFAKIDILKVDIEGAELEVFRDGIDDCLDAIDCIMVETHDRFRPGSDQAVSAALASSFREMRRVGENRIFRRRA